MRYTLHTSKEADWEGLDRKSLNGWQKLAIRSHGLITPGNIASLIGGIAALYGLWIIVDGQTVEGLAFLAAGRIADVADGIIAEYTKTKSPLGEVVDASIDKIIVGATLLVLGAINLVPWIIIVIAALQNIANVIISVVAKLRNKIIHPSRIGKVSAAFCWVTMILYPLGDLLRKEGHTASGKFLIYVAIASFFVYMVMGLQASFGYGLVIYKKPARKIYRLFK